MNQTRDTILVEQGAIAASPWARMKGLLGSRPLEQGQGLLLKGEKAIHTIGMGFAIDVLFLDRSGRIVELYPSMPPLRASRYVWRAADVLELPSGTCARTGTVVGDVVTLDL